MDFSLLLAQSSKCLFILSYIDLLVWPTYFLSHSSHFISYTHPLVRQFICTPCLHITQFSRPHFRTLNGLLRCSSRFTVLSIFSTFIFNLFTFASFLHLFQHHQIFCNINEHNTLKFFSIVPRSFLSIFRLPSFIVLLSS